MIYADEFLLFYYRVERLSCSGIYLMPELQPHAQYPYTCHIGKLKSDLMKGRNSGRHGRSILHAGTIPQNNQSIH
jgi:hypothetical protein